MEKMATTENLIYKTNTWVYNFQQFETGRQFGDSIYEGKIILSDVHKSKSNWLNKFIQFNKGAKPKT